MIVSNPEPCPAPVTPKPAQKSLADSLFDRAEAAIAEGRVASPLGDNALELILDGEKLEPSNPRGAEARKHAAAALLGSAGVLWDHGKQDSAKALYADALLFEPDDETAKARAKERPKQPVVRKPSVDEIPWLVAQIDLAIIERRLVAPPGHNALEFLLRLRAIDPTNDATRRLGLEVASALQVAAKDAPPTEQEALATASKVATPDDPAKPAEKTRDPGAALELVKTGNAALGSGDLAGARKAFEQAITADAGAHAALFGLAEVAYNEADYTRAVLAGKRAVAMAPRVAGYHMSLGKAYYKLLRYDDAIAQWKTVLQLEPDNAGAQKNIEMAERRMGK